MSLHSFRNMATQIRTLVLLLLTVNGALAIRCLSNDGNEVDWWVSLKPPQQGDPKTVAKDYYYMDSANPDGKITNDDTPPLEMLFRRHLELLHQDPLTAGYTINRIGLGMLKYYYNDYRPSRLTQHMSPSKFQQDAFEAVPEEEMEAIYSKLSTMQLWFNDQITAGKTTKLVDDITIPKSSPDTTGVIRFAHSKYGLFWNTKDKTGYLIQHSYPEAPYTIYEEHGAWNSAFFNTRKEARNVFLRAQHAFCFSFSGEEGTFIMEQLRHARLRFVNSNLPLWLIEKLMDPKRFEIVSDLVKGDKMEAIAEKCHSRWEIHVGLSKTYGQPVGDDTLEKHAIKLLEKQEDRIGKDGSSYFKMVDGFECTNVHSYMQNKIEVISFIPTPHDKGLGGKTELDALNKPLKNDFAKSTEKIIKALETPGRPVNELGPIPWFTVSNLLKVPLYLDFWINRNIPSIKSKYGLYSITKVEFPASKTNNANVGWTFGQSHMKLGVSADSSRPYVCFGDANHRRSEVTHAGMMICLENADMHKVIREMIISIDKAARWAILPGIYSAPPHMVSQDFALSTSAAPPNFKIPYLNQQVGVVMNEIAKAMPHDANHQSLPMDKFERKTRFNKAFQKATTENKALIAKLKQTQ